MEKETWQEIFREKFTSEASKTLNGEKLLWGKVEDAIEVIEIIVSVAKREEKQALLNMLKAEYKDILNDPEITGEFKEGCLRAIIDIIETINDDIIEMITN